MSIQDIAKTFVELCRAGKNLEALDTLYDPDAISIEACDGPAFPRISKTRAALIEKNTWWYENHEIHEAHVSDPMINGDDQFACIWRIDVTFKPNNSRMQMEEIAVFTVRDGKICEEKFYYSIPG